IRRIVKGTVVVHGPIRELKIAVGAVSVEVEEICRAHLAEADFDASLGKLREERKRRAVADDFFAAQRNDLGPHQASYVRGCADCGSSHYVDVSESGYTQGFADAVPSGGLHVAKELSAAGEAQPGEQCQDTGSGFLRVSGEAVASGVGRMKLGMPL